MGSLIDAFDAAFARFLVWLAVLVAVSVGLIAILIPLNLFLVTVRWGSFPWLFEAVEYALYVGCSSARPGCCGRARISASYVVTAALPRTAAARLEKVLDVAGCLLCLLLCVYGLRLTLLEFQTDTAGQGSPDRELVHDGGFALSFLLLAIEFALRFRRAAEVLEETRARPPGSGF